MDMHVLGTASALLRLARDVVDDVLHCKPRSTNNKKAHPHRALSSNGCESNGCDAHAMLGGALQRQFARDEVRFAGLRELGLGERLLRLPHNLLRLPLVEQGLVCNLTSRGKAGLQFSKRLEPS